MSASDETLVLHPDVTAFVDEVRRHLGDLDDETRDDLLGGLEADLADQLAEGTGAPLGDPAAYAAELRSAAGLPEPPSPRRLRPDPRRWQALPGELMDRSRAWFLGYAESPRLRPAWDVAVTLRPAWWALRAWVAVSAIDVYAGSFERVSLIPTLGSPLIGLVVLAVAVAVSALIGLGRLWPGSGPDRKAVARLLLLAANVYAVVLPFAADFQGRGVIDDTYDSYSIGWNDALRQSGVMSSGRPVTDIFAYDAAGKPIDQVQLVDQDGRPISIRLRDAIRDDFTERRSVPCPAYNGDTPVTNAFPFARLPLVDGRCTPERAAAGATKPTPPLASLPPITPAWPVPEVPAAE
ncbi:hypothetical protein [Pimelobacter sp. 30-1]|uniref:hypothetical protein n=1 Tax=Pimelobacter TaxID=2044 RepID=UPI001C059EC0|nr:hypothetical protein [Pimelobacter sp. 30-1]MBU2694201.1 hypothetical protein [Pimelobacter sp. 30-1]